MKKFIHTVTVTGADDTIRPEQVIDLALQCPHIEFGILVSERRTGSSRYPTLDWWLAMEKACSKVGFTPKFSCHVCGRYARDILLGSFPEELDIIDPTLMFKRYQLNTHGIRHKFNAEILSALLSSFEEDGQRFIFQHDHRNMELIDTMVKLNPIQMLYDASGGNGVTPETWMPPMPDMPCGYAGGLSPSNVAQHIEAIGKLVGDHKIWIDAETRLRDEHDKFSPQLVRAFYDAALPWVEPNQE